MIELGTLKDWKALFPRQNMKNFGKKTPKNDKNDQRIGID